MSAKTVPGSDIVGGGRRTIIVHTPAGRHWVGDHGLVPVTSPTPSPQTSAAPAPRRPPQQRGRGRGRGRSRVCAETAPSTSASQAQRKETQSDGRNSTQPRGRKRTGAAAKNAPAAKKPRQTEEGEDELQQHIRVLGLPFRFRDPTLGDGNCWFNACCDQVNIS